MHDVETGDDIKPRTPTPRNDLVTVPMSSHILLVVPVLAGLNYLGVPVLAGKNCLAVPVLAGR